MRTACHRFCNFNENTGDVNDENTGLTSRTYLLQSERQEQAMDDKNDKRRKQSTDD